MQLFSTPYSLPLYVASLISLALGFYGWRNRKVPAATPFAFLMAAVSFWAFAYAQELNLADFQLRLLWAKAQYVSIVVVPIAWVTIASRYTSQDEWLDRKRPYRYLLAIIPIITLTLVWTNEQHGLIWPQISEATYPGYTILLFDHGLFFWVYFIFSYLLVLSGTILITRRYFQKQSIYKWQSQSMLFAAFIPWASNFIYVSGLNPIPALDLTPFAFALTGLVMAYSLFRFSFLKITPIAHDAVVQWLKDAVLVLDSDGTIIEANESARQLWQIPDTDIIGQSIALLPEINTHLEQASEDPFQKEITVTHHGQSYQYELTSAPLFTKHVKTLGRLVVLHDISTYKTHMADLQTAREEAESAARSKSHFLANMSHEIRTPLNAVVGMGTLLAETELTSEQKDLLDTINRSSDQLLGIINNLLDYSQMEAGSLKLEKRPFSLRNCAQSAAAVIAPDARDKGLKFSLNIPDTLPDTFLGDAVRLHQILVNLLQNAVKFTEEGGISLSLDVQPLDNSHAQVTFAVQDSGIGISLEQQQQLFTSFGQLDDSMTRTHGGLGLGLAISLHLSQLMGGSIHVESEPGKGSTFTVTAVMVQSADEPTHFFNKSQPSLRSKRVLIIAPNGANRRQVSTETRKAGMQAYVAGSTSEGLYWLRRSDPFDVALLEQSMLGEANPTLVTQINAEIERRRIPLILMLDEDQPAISGSKLQATATLNHPVTAAQLYNILIGALTMGKPAAETAESPAPLPRAGNGEMANRHPLRILLVEDNIINQRVATRLLQKLGYEPVLATNGQEALNELEENPFDVILMDIQMPVMDGMEATKAIHERFSPEHRPTIIAVTAHAMEGDRENYLAQGMDDYLSKPIQVDQLVEALYRCKPDAVTQLPAKDEKPSQSHPVEKNGTVENSQPTQQSPILDIAVLQRMVGESAEAFLIDMLPSFYTDAESLLADMHRGQEQGRIVDIQKAAHTLKGASASLGMISLSKSCFAVEEAARSGNAQATQTAVSSLAGTYQTVKQALSHYNH